MGCFCSYTLEEIAEGVATFLISGHLASILGDLVWIIPILLEFGIIIFFEPMDACMGKFKIHAFKLKYFVCV